MKKFLKRSVLLGLIFLAAACSTDPIDEVLEHGADFESYSIENYESSEISKTIDKKNHTILIQLPSELKDGSGLRPKFTASKNATVTMKGNPQTSGTVTLNFNETQQYTITSEDKQVANRWEVTVTNNDYTIPWGLGIILAEECSNNGSCDFYFQQQHTGPYSDNNCGPTAAVMAMKWYDSSFTGTVEKAREEIPSSEKAGGLNWYPEDVYNYIERHGAKPYFLDFNKSSYAEYVHAIREKLQEGCIAICCINMSSVTISENPDSEQRVNKYYPGTFGHFLLIKGYKEMAGTGKTWFEIHDPWGLDKKYTDGTFVGANRYYLALEVAKCIDWNKLTVVIPPR